MNAFQALGQIQSKTLAARARTGNNGVGTKVKAGRVQVVDVTFDAKGNSTVKPLSDWGSQDEAMKFLDALA